MLNAPTVYYSETERTLESLRGLLQNAVTRVVGLVVGALGVLLTIFVSLGIAVPSDPKFCSQVVMIVFGMRPAISRASRFRTSMMWPLLSFLLFLISWTRKIFLAVPRGTCRALSKKKEVISDWNTEVVGVCPRLARSKQPFGILFVVSRTLMSCDTAQI